MHTSTVCHCRLCDSIDCRACGSSEATDADKLCDECRAELAAVEAPTGAELRARRDAADRAARVQTAALYARLCAELAANER